MAAQTRNTPSTPIPENLPQIGKSRWAQLKTFIPVSRETWRQMVLEGRAPQPQRLSARCTVWDNGEIHRWLADPTGYRVPAPAPAAQ